VYGEWLRRGNRRAEARAQLRTAYDLFVEMGIDGFASRTSRELAAAGVTVNQPVKGAAITLTTQERHITRLVCEGHTNSEIAAQLFISPRTVEWHLSHIFAKVGVRSRREIRSLAIDLP
jgi:DNA-binding CsgD family transcriptional regulator